MTAHSPFVPHYGSNQLVTPAAGALTATISKNDTSVRLVNSGAAICYVRLYNSANGAQVATTADFPVLNGQTATIRKPLDFDTISYISATGTTLQVMTGEGGFN